MAAINFPSSPVTGLSHTENGQTWYYDGVKWVSGGTFGQSALTPMYQEGAWTPAWIQGIYPGSYVSTFGKWSRTGNLVFIAGRIQGSGGSTDSSAVRLGQLPFKQAPGTGEGAVTIGYPGPMFGAPPYPFWCLIPADQDFFQFFTNGGGQLIGDDVAAIANTLHFSGSYLTDDTTWTPINGATVS